MKRNKQSQVSINEFMGGYSNFVMPPLFGNSIISGASGNITGSPYGNNTVNNSIIGGGLFGEQFQKLKHFSGDKKTVRLFEHCVKDSGFLGGWFDSVTPQKSKTVRLKLGKKGQTTDNTLSAVYVPTGYDVILHEFPRSSPKFESGKHKILRKSSTCLSTKGLNDIVSEIDIVPQASGLGNLSEYLQGWGTRVSNNPVQTLGNYGGVRGKPGTNRPLATDTRVVNDRDTRDTSTVVGQQPQIPGKPAYYPPDEPITVRNNPNDLTPQSQTPSSSGSSPASSGSSWSPPKPDAKPTKGTGSYSQPTKFTNQELVDLTPSLKSEEEESIFKNPIVWVGIAVVVMGLIYVMMDDDKKSVKAVVSAKPTPSPVKKMARKGMKVRSGRKIKRSGRIKK